MKKLTTKEKLGACGVLYAGILNLLGQMNSRLMPLFLLTLFASLGVAALEGLLWLATAMRGQANATFKAVTIAALLLALINLIAVATTAI